MSIPALHNVVPGFSLPDLEGHPVSPWDFKHRRPLVLVFCPEGDQDLLDDFAHHYETYRNESAEVLAILTRQPSQGEWPFPVLFDRERQVTARYVEHTPAILVLDSYNELVARFEGLEEERPDHRQIISTIAEEELRCPECGAPAWPH